MEGVMVMYPGCEWYDEAVELLGDETLKICRIYSPEVDAIGLVVLFNEEQRAAEAVTMAKLCEPRREDTKTVPAAIFVAPSV